MDREGHHKIIGGHQRNFQAIAQYLDIDDLRMIPLVSSDHKNALRMTVFQHLSFYIIGSSFGISDPDIVFTDEKCDNDGKIILSDSRSTWISTSQRSLCELIDAHKGVENVVDRWMMNASHCDVIENTNIVLPDYAKHMLSQTISADIVIYERLLGRNIPVEMDEESKLLKYGREESALHKLVCCSATDNTNTGTNTNDNKQKWQRYIFKDFCIYNPGRITTIMCKECLDMPRSFCSKESVSSRRKVVSRNQGCSSCRCYSKCRQSKTRQMSGTCEEKVPPKYLFRIQNMIGRDKVFGHNESLNSLARNNQRLIHRFMTQKTLRKKQPPQITNLPTEAKNMIKLSITVVHSESFGCTEWRNSVIGTECIQTCYNFVRVVENVLPISRQPKNENTGDVYDSNLNIPVPDTFDKIYFCNSIKVQNYVRVYNTLGMDTQIGASFPSLLVLQLSRRGHVVDRPSHISYYNCNMTNIDHYFVSTTYNTLDNLRHLILRDAPICQNLISSFVDRHGSLDELTFVYTPSYVDERSSNLWFYLSNTVLRRDGNNDVRKRIFKSIRYIHIKSRTHIDCDYNCSGFLYKEYDRSNGGICILDEHLQESRLHCKESPVRHCEVCF